VDTPANLARRWATSRSPAVPSPTSTPAPGWRRTSRSPVGGSSMSARARRRTASRRSTRRARSSRPATSSRTRTRGACTRRPRCSRWRCRTGRRRSSTTTCSSSSPTASRACAGSSTRWRTRRRTCAGSRGLPRSRPMKTRRRRSPPRSSRRCCPGPRSSRAARSRTGWPWRAASRGWRRGSRPPRRPGGASRATMPARPMTASRSCRRPGSPPTTRRSPAPRRSRGCGWGCGRCCGSRRCARTSRRCCTISRR
jgi:hypothetical protein